MTNARIQVNLKTYQRKWRINRPAIKQFLQKAWSKLAVEVATAAPAKPGKRREGRTGFSPYAALSSEVTVVFLNNPRIQWYNLTFRKKGYPTDVLSFPVNEVTVEKRHYLGDILISVEKAADQAREKRHPLGRELQILLLHGMIHLLGFDHETDSGEMDRLENRLRKKLITRQSLTL